MSDNSYEEYKKDMSRKREREDSRYRGKRMLIGGTLVLIYLLVILPFKAGNMGEMRGDEAKAGGAYERVHVYYIDRLQILRVKRQESSDDGIYAVARFFDCDQKEWIICFTPGDNEELEERIRLAVRFNKETELTIGGYFRFESLGELPTAGEVFYSGSAGQYADAEGSNLLEMNAEYLCGKTENYTLSALLGRGIPLYSLILGGIGVLWGGFLLIKNRRL